MAVTIHSADVQALADKVSALNQEIDSFYKTHGDTVRLTGRCNYNTDGDRYLEVNIDITSVVASLS